MSRLENDLAKLILENNNKNGINSNGPNNKSFSSNATKVSLSVPSIVVSNDTCSNGIPIKKDGFLNVNSGFKRTTSSNVSSPPPPILIVNTSKSSSSSNSTSSGDSTLASSSSSTTTTTTSNNSSSSNSDDSKKEKEKDEKQIINDFINNIIKNNGEKIYDRKLLEQSKQKNKQFKENRVPSNVLIFEDIDDDKAQMLKLWVEDQNLNFSFSVQLVRYMAHFKSLMLVFSHANEAELCKLLVTRQDSIKLDSNTTVYFGKETPLELVNKSQLKTPFPSRQYLISPPISPPNEWNAPGDGMEQPPSDIDPFAEVTTIRVATSNNNANGDQLSVVGNDSNCCDDNENDIQRSYKKVIYQDNTSNNFPSITLEFCT